MERHLHPSIYEKIEITENLLKKGVSKEDLISQGGLDFKTYSALQERWREADQQTMEYEDDIRSKYGSIINAPISIGPCKKHDPPIIGNKNALVLLAEFNDVKHSHEPSEFNDLLFNKQSKGSMRNYYLEASWNQLDISGMVNNEWNTLNGDISDYVDEKPVNNHYPKARELVKEIIEKTKDNRMINFNDFSVDGKVEPLIIIFAGSGMDTTLNVKHIRPHQDRLSEPIEVSDGVWVDKYCLVSELPFNDVGVFCHEMGHILGLPDLYKEGYSPIVGSWCIMSVGGYLDDGKTPAHPSAWCKLHLGWTEPILIDKIPQNHEIPAVIDNKSIYRVDVTGSDGKEYFLLENRQQKGFDEYLPASGLLIWHVNENVCIQKRVPNSDPKHFFLTLKQSDGKDDLQRDRTEQIKKARTGDKLPKDVMGDEGDPFPGITGNKLFDDESNPNSRSYEGKKSFVKVKSISDSADLMKAEMGVESHSGNNKDSKVQTKKFYKYNFKYPMYPQMINPMFINFIASKPKAKNHEDSMYDLIMDVFLSEFKEDNHLKLYGEGYSIGYRKGYVEALIYKKKANL